MPEWLRSAVPDGVASDPFRFVREVSAAQEMFIRSRIHALRAIASMDAPSPIVGVVGEQDILARAVRFPDESTAIVLSSGLMNFFWAYCRALACCIDPVQLPASPMTLVGATSAPMKFIDAQCCLLVLFTNFMKLGVVIAESRAEARQAWVGERVYHAVLDLVIGHELAHLSLHDLRKVSMKDEMEADQVAFSAVEALHGEYFTGLAIAVFFGATAAAYRYMDPEASRTMCLRGKKGLARYGSVLSSAFWKSSDGAATATQDETFGTTALELALRRSETDDWYFLESVLRWFLVGVPSRALAQIKDLVATNVEREFPSTSREDRVRLFKAAHEASAAPQVLRRLSLLHSLLDVGSAASIEMAIA